MKKYARVTLFVSLLILLAVSLITLLPKEESFLESEEEGEEAGPDTRPNEWAWLQRTYPYFDADPGATIDAINEAKIIRKAHTLKKTNSTNWQFAGPLNIGGRIVDIEFNPLDPNIVYAGAATGGVLKSTDHGSSWFPVFDDQSNLSIGDIGIDPVNPDNIYVGTGEANGGHNNFPGGGMFKSTDAGATWNHVGLESTASIGRVLVNPHNPDIVYAAAVGSYFKPNPERGVYKSTDAGTTWGKVFFISDSTGAIDLVMHPDNPDTLFVAMWERVRGAYTAHLNGPTSGIFRTYDSFNSEPVELNESNGLPNPAAGNIGRIGLTMFNNDPNILYALYNDGVNYLGFYRSNNLGETWTNADSTNAILGGTAYPSGFSWYFGQTRVHPEDPDIVYAMDVRMMRSTNGGREWDINIATTVHVDFHALAFDPNDSDFMITGCDGGIYTSSNGGSSWSLGAELPVTQFYEIGLDNNNPQRLYGGTQDNGTNRTLEGGLDDWEGIYGGDGFYVIVDYSDPQYIYAESQRGALGKSTNGGVNFTGATRGISSNDPKNWSTPVVIDPNNPRKLYYGTNKLYRTTDRAENWTAISSSLTTNPASSMVGTITTISVAKTDSNYIYVGTDDGNVQATYDGGATWHLLSEALPVRWVTRVLVDPTDEQIVYVTLSGLKWREPQPHVFKSTNAGVSWTNISGNLPDAPVNAIAVDLIDHNIIYIGSDVGVFYTRDGVSWTSLGEGLPIVPVNDMKIHPTENYLAAGTHARGIYKIDLNPITGVEKTENVPTGFILSQNYPNPFNPSTKIRYRITQTGKVELKIFNAIGEKVSTLVSEIQSPGKYEIGFDGKELSSGVYIYTISVGDFSKTKKMILLK